MGTERGDSHWTTGDVFRIIYPNPLTANDRYRFTPRFSLGETENVEIEQFELLQSYPNPFNPVTTIPYNVPTAGPIKLEIYNLRGQRVKTLLDTETEAGKYGVLWHGRDDAGQPVASGLYFYRLRGNGFDKTDKMLLMK